MQKLHEVNSVKLEVIKLNDDGEPCLFGRTMEKASASLWQLPQEEKYPAWRLVTQLEGPTDNLTFDGCNQALIFDRRKKNYLCRVSCDGEVVFERKRIINPPKPMESQDANPIPDQFWELLALVKSMNNDIDGPDQRRRIRNRQLAGLTLQTAGGMEK
jgi:hypothetical protein